MTPETRNTILKFIVVEAVDRRGEAVRKNSTGRSRVGIRQIAHELGLSVCTVSKILNNKLENISYRPETIQRVRAAAAGYRPDLIARALVKGSTRSIGLCVADIANPLLGELTSRIAALAAEQGYSCAICNTGEDPQMEERHLQQLMDRRVDAIIISPVAKQSAVMLREAVAAGRRVVVVDRDLPGKDFCHVEINNREAMADLTRRCLALGHRRIGVLAGRREDVSLQLRLAGAQDALASWNMDARKSLVVSEACDSTTIEAGQIGMVELLKSSLRPTLILSLANQLSIGALHGAKAAGVAIGRDVAFAGFDDFESATLVEPAITVVAQPIASIAAACADFALSQSADKPGQKCCLKARIRWRDSVCSSSDCRRWPPSAFSKR